MTYDEQFRALYCAAYRVGYRILGDRTEAEDIAQEALARAYLAWRRISGNADPWVTRVAANLAIDKYRRIAKAPRQQAIDATQDLYLAERLDLVRALRALPRRQREVVMLRYVADQSEETVARALGCSVGSVKTHASRGLAALRTRFQAGG